MADLPSIRVREVSFAVIPTKTRFPFRYGIAAMTEAPHWFVRCRVEVNGRLVTGLTSEGLPPKWFTKNPSTTFEDDDLPGMEKVIRHAARLATEIGASKNFFVFWKELVQRQTDWAQAENIPPLLAQLGTALMERCVLDGMAKALELPFHQLMNRNLVGLSGESFPEICDETLNRVLSGEGLKKLSVRHTVGLADPLTDSDIATEDRAEDELPQSLEANIRGYGLRYFKVKLCGDLEKDSERLADLNRLFEKTAPEDYRLSLDGNEQFDSVELFRDHFESHRSEPATASLFDHLLFVEQPIHRDHALEDSVKKGFESWEMAPPVIIDESDAEIESLPQALALGYAGTSHKNCKGVLKSLLNKARIDEAGGLMSAEDLANIGPVALLQDLAVVSFLGIDHVERNGHHYFAGLSMFPESVQRAAVKRHGDLYSEGRQGGAFMAIRDGMISAESVSAAPFGCTLSSGVFDDLPGGWRSFVVAE